MSWRAGGIRPWITQRLSAVFMVLGIFLFTIKIAAGNTDSYSAWAGWMTDPIWVVFIIVFWLSLFAHAWVGTRDVIMDYIHPDGLRFAVLALFGFYLIAMTIWMLKIFFMVGN